MARGQCRHGYRPSSSGGVVVRGSRLTRIEKHERKCGGSLVGHGFIFSTVCCLGCGRTL